MTGDAPAIRPIALVVLRCYADRPDGGDLLDVHRFTYRGEAGLYERDDLGVVLDTGDPVGWRSVEAFRVGAALLFPAAILDVL